MGTLHTAILETLPELVRWLPWARPGHSRTDTRRYVRGARVAWLRGQAYDFVIEELDGSDPLGIVSLHRMDRGRRSAGLGYWIRRTRQREGLASEAAACVIEHAFRDLALNRIEMHIHPENQASQRVAERLGFEREGVARQVEWVAGAFQDHVQYGLLHSDVIARTGGSS